MKAFAGISIAAALTSLCLVTANARPLPITGGGAPLAAGYMQDRDRGWDAPPPELDEASRRGYHDGLEGARKDYENHRRPDVNNRDEFRHPDVRERDREAYRHGFERGYHRGVEHFYNGR